MSFVAWNLLTAEVVACPGLITGKTYTGLRMAAPGEFAAWLYHDGQFQGVLAATTTGPLVGETDVGEVLQAIPSDPSDTVGDHSLLMGAGDSFYVWDLASGSFYVHPPAALTAPIWADGWIWFLDTSSGSPSLRKIHPDMTGEVIVSTLSSVGSIVYGGREWLTDEAYYAMALDTSTGQWDRISRFPLDGSAPDSGIGFLPGDRSAPGTRGLPAQGGNALRAVANFTGRLNLSLFDGATRTDSLLWEDGWVQWIDANSSGSPFDLGALSFSVNPAGDEAVVYRADNAGNRGILRTAIEPISSTCPPPILTVTQGSGSYPDFMVARD